MAALVAGARRLQPLLAKAQRLRRAAKDAPRRREEFDGEILLPGHPAIACMLAKGMICASTTLQ